MTDPHCQLLLIEDNLDYASLIREMLTEINRQIAPLRSYSLALESCLADGLERLRGLPTDLVLLDLGLPDSQGLETLECLIGAWPDVPVVVLTGQEDMPMARAAIVAGAQDYLPKTELDKQSLRRSLRYALERHCIQRALVKKSASLALERKRFERLAEESRNGILVVSRQDRIIYANPAAQKLLGRSSEQLRQAPFGFPILSGKTEITLNRPDGSLVFADMSVAEIEWDERAWLVNLYDLTARLLAEEHLELMRRMFDQSSDGMLITDDQMRIIRVNHGFTLITGYSGDEAMGKNPRFLKSGRHDRAFYKTMWQELEKQGTWSGELWNRRKNGEIYAQWNSIVALRNSLGDIVNYAAVFSDINALKNQERDLQHRATHDALTNLLNRHGLEAKLDADIERVRANRQGLALLFIDLDGFKEVNDTLGHLRGDELLQVIARRLVHAVRSTDTVARLGGDEFIVIFESVRGRYEVTGRVSKLIEKLSEPYRLGGNKVEISGSIGISLFPGDGDDRNMLIALADEAMYRAKKRKNAFEFVQKGKQKRQRRDTPSESHA